MLLIEYFLQRAKFEEMEQKLNEESQLLRMKNVSISKELDDLRQRAQQEIHINKELADKKSEEYTSKYKSQVRLKEDTLQVVKDQYSKVQHIYIAKIKTLEEALGGLKTRYEDLKNKKNLEISGYKSEIKSLRQQFKTLVRDLEEQRGGLGVGSGPTVGIMKTKPKVSKQKSLGVRKTKKGARVEGDWKYMDDGDGDEESVRLDDIKQLKVWLFFLMGVG